MESMYPTTNVPSERIQQANHSPVHTDGQYVVYWMTAFRRVESNFALQRARDWAVELQRPLLIFEGLRCDYPWASDRFHQFVIQGMLDNSIQCSTAGVAYFPYVEPWLKAGKGLLECLAKDACLVVSDDFPCFFHPGMYSRIADRLTCRFELVDANCLMPLTVADRTFTVAHSYRRWMQKTLPTHIQCSPEAKPLRKSAMKSVPPLVELPKAVADCWPAADLQKLLLPGGLGALPIDHSIPPTEITGGTTAARTILQRFLSVRVQKYDHDRNEPDLNGSTTLSPYLHFGHISAHEVFWQIMESQDWNPSRLGKPNGKVSGFWGVEPNCEALLDQLCTWREIGFNMCHREPNYAEYESLPSWAQTTLLEHEADVRPFQYSLEQFEKAETHDPIWNAAQRQLLREGRIHNYLRMLWGKKILHWTPNARQALGIMVELNNKYALDGRDPNSYSGIFWVLGRYDRAWGPERPVFGKIRYMTSENTAKKHSLGRYLLKYGP